MNAQPNPSFLLHAFAAAFWICTIAAAVLVIAFGYIAATESESGRKGRARLIASLAFCSWLGIAPLLWLLYDRSLPILEFQGSIVRVDVRNSSSRYYSAYLQIHTTLGGDVTVHASDRSPFIRPGQGLFVRYRGDTGELVKATFYTPNGKQEGVLRSSRAFGQIIVILIAIFCAWASIRRYRHDPEGAVEDVDYRRNDSSESIGLSPLKE